MRITTVEGEKVWLNPQRVDTMKTVTAPVDNEVVPAVRIQTPNSVFVCLNDFETLCNDLDTERKR